MTKRILSQFQNLFSKLENVLFSRGFYPTISTVTHKKPGCKPSCLDNIITNDIESVISSRTIPNTITHHHQIFQIFESTTHKLNSNPKFAQYYDYCSSNVEKFVECLSEDIGNSPIDSFATFTTIFQENLDKTCRLETPKCSKRTLQNNPWITHGIIVSVNQCDTLYHKWRKSRKKKCKEGENMIVVEHVCVKYVAKNVTSIHNIRNTVKNIKKCVRMPRKNITKANLKKNRRYKENMGNHKQNQGKNKRQKIKPQFVINNEKITDRRIIVNEFNKYFVSLASNLNNAYHEIGELYTGSTQYIVLQNIYVDFNYILL